MNGRFSNFGSTWSQIGEVKNLSTLAHVVIASLSIAIIPLTAYILKPRFGDITLWFISLNEIYGFLFSLGTYFFTHVFIVLMKQLLVYHDFKTRMIYGLVAIVCSVALGKIVIVQVSQLKQVSELKRKDFDTKDIQSNPLLVNAREDREKAETNYIDVFKEVNKGKGDNVVNLVAKANQEVARYRWAALRDTTGAIKAGAGAVAASALAASNYAESVKARVESNNSALSVAQSRMIAAQKNEKVVQDSLLAERGKMGRFDSPVAWAIEILLACTAVVLSCLQLMRNGKAERITIAMPERPERPSTVKPQEEEPEDGLPAGIDVDQREQRDTVSVPLQAELSEFSPDSECPKDKERARCWIIYRYVNGLLAEGDYSRVSKATGLARVAPLQWLRQYIAKTTDRKVGEVGKNEIKMLPKKKVRRGIVLTPENGVHH